MQKIAGPGHGADSLATAPQQKKTRARVFCYAAAKLQKFSSTRSRSSFFGPATPNACCLCSVAATLQNCRGPGHRADSLARPHGKKARRPFFAPQLQAAEIWRSQPRSSFFGPATRVIFAPWLLSSRCLKDPVTEQILWTRPHGKKNAGAFFCCAAAAKLQKFGGPGHGVDSLEPATLQKANTGAFIALLCGCAAQRPTFLGTGPRSQKTKHRRFFVLLRGCSAGELWGTRPCSK